MEKYRRSITEVGNLVYIALTETAPVAAGGNQITDLTAPAGYILQPLSFGIYAAAPAGATSGTHNCTIFNSDAATVLGVLLTKAYSGPLCMYYNDPGYQTTSYSPSDKVAFLQALQSLYILPGSMLRFRYDNATDAIQNNTRYMYVRYRLIPVS